MKLTKRSIYKSLVTFTLVFTSLTLVLEESVSKETVPSQIIAWFDALKGVDSATLQVLLADEAIIELKDLGVVQTKGEFIDSLDEWAQANAGAEILTKAVSINGDEVAMKVCYRFVSNEVLNLETYNLVHDKITHSVQEHVSDSCKDF